MNILGALRGIGGEFEVNRVVGAFGAAVYIVGAQIFVAWNIVEGHPFDLVAYCAAFPGGLAVLIGAIAGAVSLKDRNVATATVVRDTGAMPTTQPTGQPAGTRDDPLIIAGAPAGSAAVITTPERKG